MSSRRENSEMVTTACAARAVCRGEPSPADALAQPEPLGMRDERDVVDRDDGRNVEPERRRVGRREEHVQVIGRATAAAGGPAPTSVPPRPAHVARGKPAGVERQSRAAPARTARTRGARARSSAAHSPQQPRKVPADAGRLSAQLARVYADAHRRCSIARSVGARTTAARRCRPSRTGGNARGPCATQDAANALVVDQPLDRCARRTVGVVRIDEQTRVAERLRAARRDSRRRPARRAVIASSTGNPEAFVEGRLHQQTGALVQRAAVRAST